MTHGQVQQLSLVVMGLVSKLLLNEDWENLQEYVDTGQLEFIYEFHSFFNLYGVSPT
jgi:hypothetical protein